MSRDRIEASEALLSWRSIAADFWTGAPSIGLLPSSSSGNAPFCSISSSLSWAKSASVVANVAGISKDWRIQPSLAHMSWMTGLPDALRSISPWVQASACWSMRNIFSTVAVRTMVMFSRTSA